MPKKSKGNITDFIADCSTDPKLRNNFLTQLYGKGVTANDILKFFYSENYNGVSLADCNKLLIAVKQGPLPCDFTVRY